MEARLARLIANTVVLATLATGARSDSRSSSTIDLGNETGPLLGGSAESYVIGIGLLGDPITNSNKENTRKLPQPSVKSTVNLVDPEIIFPSSPPSQEIQDLLDVYPQSHWIRVTLIEQIDWKSIKWDGKPRDHWDPIWLAGIDQGGEMWSVGFTPIDIVGGITFPVQQRACPDPDSTGFYHPPLWGEKVEIWNNGLAGFDIHGYDPEERRIYAHQAFCVK